MSCLFTSGGQNIGASASVLLKNIQDGFPLGLAGLMEAWTQPVAGPERREWGPVWEEALSDSLMLGLGRLGRRRRGRRINSDSWALS